MARIYIFDLENVLKHSIIEKFNNDPNDDKSFTIKRPSDGFVFGFIFDDILATPILQLKLNSSEMEVLNKKLHESGLRKHYA